MAVVHKGHLGDHEKKIDYWIINQGAWEPGHGTSSFPNNIYLFFYICIGV